ncbi:hypothetical protein PR048_003144 [Dryococelus australis]|uniref:Uncharacterized protein n=1 Tax=Dryococelus australis TaxID=614101 RepID=A0ABQ9IMC2_9NEOP|nr:hypothetical protein PR048_003144 [Dryococelus australis]
MGLCEGQCLDNSYIRSCNSATTDIHSHYIGHSCNLIPKVATLSRTVYKRRKVEKQTAQLNAEFVSGKQYHHARLTPERINPTETMNYEVALNARRTLSEDIYAAAHRKRHDFVCLRSLYLPRHEHRQNSHTVTRCRSHVSDPSKAGKLCSQEAPSRCSGHRVHARAHTAPRAYRGLCLFLYNYPLADDVDNASTQSCWRSTTLLVCGEAGKRTSFTAEDSRRNSQLGEELLVFHLGVPRPHVGIVVDDAAGRRVSSGISRFPRHGTSGAAPYSAHFTFINSQDLVLRAAQITPPHSNHIKTVAERITRVFFPTYKRRNNCTTTVLATLGSLVTETKEEDVAQPLSTEHKEISWRVFALTAEMNIKNSTKIQHEEVTKLMNRILVRDTSRRGKPRYQCPHWLCGTPVENISANLIDDVHSAGLCMKILPFPPQRYNDTGSDIAPQAAKQVEVIFGKPWKTEIRIAGLGIEPVSSRMRVQQFDCCANSLGRLQREHCTPVLSLVLSGDGALDANGSLFFIAPALVGLKRGKKLHAGREA